MKPVTVPFFISHQGCPHTCVFCDQRLISGSGGSLPTPEEIALKIEKWQTTAGIRPLEVAFFGGSFTALPQKIQAELLSPLQLFLKSGAIRSVRLSTRPDCIDDGRVAYLAEMGIQTIELGVQSMDDNVLTLSGRGHTATESDDAIRCIKKYNLSVGAQLMPGLPGDTPALSLASLERVISAGVDFIRIYPTVVLRGTELARRYAKGEYLPLTFHDGVSLCKKLLHRAMQAGLPVIRIGLQGDEGLNEDTLLAGCWHPALGQIVRSDIYGDLLCQMLSWVPASRPVAVKCHSRRISDVTGLARANLKRSQLRERDVRIIADNRLSENELQVEVKQDISEPCPDHPLGVKGVLFFKGNIITDLHYFSKEPENAS